MTKALFEELILVSDLDSVDWKSALQFSERWKVGLVDALLDLGFVNETVLAKSLASCHGMGYVAGTEIRCDFSEVELDSLDDMLTVGAAPISGNRLAICDPSDDHRGILGNVICSREMVVTERSALFQEIRRHGQEEWKKRNQVD